MTKNDDRQYISQDHIYDNPGGKSYKRFDAGIRQFPETRREPDTQKTKRERPGPQGGNRRDKRGLHQLVVIGQRISVDDDRREYRSDQKSNDEFRKAPPDLAYLHL